MESMIDNYEDKTVGIWDMQMMQPRTQLKVRLF
jgi:hypothetical protein